MGDELSETVILNIGNCYFPVRTAGARLKTRAMQVGRKKKKTNNNSRDIKDLGME